MLKHHDGIPNDTPFPTERFSKHLHSFISSLDGIRHYRIQLGAKFTTKSTRVGCLQPPTEEHRVRLQPPPLLEIQTFSSRQRGNAGKSRPGFPLTGLHQLATPAAIKRVRCHAARYIYAIDRNRLARRAHTRPFLVAHTDRNGRPSRGRFKDVPIKVVPCDRDQTPDPSRIAAPAKKTKTKKRARPLVNGVPLYNQSDAVLNNAEPCVTREASAHRANLRSLRSEER